MDYQYLPNVNSPDDLKKLNFDELKILADEVRDFIIKNVKKTGGHLAPSLGAVELTIAMLYVFDLPQDKIIWDVGHQAYAYKVLTGRRDKLNTLRQLGGISGFLKREESEYDVFGAGHASTSISAALGFSVANELTNRNDRVVAVIGDGSLTGGLAYEGLNNLGTLKKQLITILNDNAMSISPNVGAISKYLHRIVSDPIYNRIRDKVWDLTSRLPIGKFMIRGGLKKLEESLKNLLVPGILFDELGVRYFGPVDGHDIQALVTTFKRLKDIKTPILIHVLTKKGKGLTEAEDDPTTFHGIQGGKIVSQAKLPAYTNVFGQTAVELAEKDDRIVAITAAMREGTGLIEFDKKFPKRFFDVGIAEGHAVTYAAGLAANGLRPIVSIYSTFMQRALDEVMHDTALQKLPVLFCLDRAGLVGPDGSTHHGVFDLSYLSMLPNIIVSAPKDGNELRNLMYSSLEVDNMPWVIRYPRDEAVRYDPSLKPVILKPGLWELLQKGKKIAIIATGSMVYESELALRMLAGVIPDVTFVNARFIKPMDTEMLKQIAESHKILLTIEENAAPGGLGQQIRAFYDDSEKLKIVNMTLPDTYITHGKRTELLQLSGLSATHIADRIKELLK
ncbi:MAG TPA: 1-deoxy-D-xylulose-5-phosphate synthase [Candidatus Marinimicrobia bacterium]|nr:1-deoxy-D-xylulose-5-phosphate synthase [Candidatus Neomarinimicrobiota bacterium]